MSSGSSVRGEGAPSDGGDARDRPQDGDAPAAAAAAAEHCLSGAASGGSHSAAPPAHLIRPAHVQQHSSSSGGGGDADGGRPRGGSWQPLVLLYAAACTVVCIAALAALGAPTAPPGSNSSYAAGTGMGFTQRLAQATGGALVAMSSMSQLARSIHTSLARRRAASAKQVVHRTLQLLERTARLDGCLAETFILTAPASSEEPGFAVHRADTRGDSIKRLVGLEGPTPPARVPQVLKAGPMGRAGRDAVEAALKSVRSKLKFSLDERTLHYAGSRYPLTVLEVTECSRSLQWIAAFWRFLTWLTTEEEAPAQQQLAGPDVFHPSLVEAWDEACYNCMDTPTVGDEVVRALDETRVANAEQAVRYALRLVAIAGPHSGDTHVLFTASGGGLVGNTPPRIDVYLVEGRLETSWLGSPPEVTRVLDVNADEKLASMLQEAKPLAAPTRQALNDALLMIPADLEAEWIKVTVGERKGSAELLRLRRRSK